MTNFEEFVRRGVAAQKAVDKIMAKENAMSTAMSFTCPKCLMMSYNANDVEQGYCGNCHEFTGQTQSRTDDIPAKALKPRRIPLVSAREAGRR